MSFEADKRELILARLLEIGATIPGIKKAYRNKLNIPEKERPAFVVVDADEAAIDPVAPGRGRPANGPQIVGMTPEIYILLDGPESTVGTTVNELRRAIIKAVMQDQSLVELCHNGDIRYEGFSTGLSAGRSMEADSGLSFTFAYALFPSRL